MASDFFRTLSEGRVGFPEALDALERHLAAGGVPAAVVASVLVVADEVISNVLDYGGGSTAPRVEISASVVDDEVTVQVVDDGVAFDPMATPPPDTSLSVEDRAIGGLGIHLVRKLMDSVGYDRRDERNHLQFSKRYSSSS